MAYIAFFAPEKQDIEKVSIIDQYYDAFMDKYSGSVLPGHLKAINAILGCRTPDSGEVYVYCPGCHHGQWQSLSCGHRNCPKCQNHEASQWIDRQLAKLLLNVSPKRRKSV
jgi:hypothetical protein